MEHTRMQLVVVAESPADFERWLAAQSAPAVAPATDAARRGEALFDSGPCQLCHSVRGTRALATLGPDLTHFASRRLLAASLPNDVATLHAWVTNAQSLKPGAQMPSLAVYTGEQLHDVVAYLNGLQ